MNAATKTATNRPGMSTARRPAALDRCAFDTVPRAREIFRDLDVADQKPAVYLVRGRGGTGKSTLLAAVRARLRARGIPLADDPTIDAADLPPRSAMVIDNAHTLTARDIEALCRTIESRHCTVVISARPHPHDRALRALVDTVARRGRVIDLRAMGVLDIGPFARELGMMVPRQLATHIHQQTAGVRGGVIAALDAARTTRTDAGMGAIDAAVTAWTRGVLDDLAPELRETLVVAAIGTGLDPTELAETLGIGTDLAQNYIDRVRATALVTDADLLLAPAVAPLRTLLGDRRFLAVQRKLLHARLDAGLLRDHTALLLAESGVRDPRLAEFLSGAADKASTDAARYYAAAAAAGAEHARIALGWAEAAAREGDGDTAIRLAEPMLVRTDLVETEQAAAVRICAGVLTRRGLVDRAARLYSWLGPSRVGADWSIGAMVMYLAGDLDCARAMTDSAAHWPPTEATARDRLIVSALAASISTGDTAVAVSELIQATRAGSVAALPCDPESVAALLCLGTGAPDRADDVVRRAHTDIAFDPSWGSKPAARRGRAERAAHGRHQLLAAWTAMFNGDELAAATTRAALDTGALDGRDRLLAHGLAVGLARRTGDRAALSAAWQRGTGLLDEVRADLLAVLPIGELWVAGVELADERRVTPLVDALWSLLHNLGEPVAWASALHWYGVQAAVAAGDSAALAHRISLLDAYDDDRAQAFAAAGAAWAQLPEGTVDLDRTRIAVDGLCELGRSWDAGTLATAAARAADRAHEYPGNTANTAGDAQVAPQLWELARTVRLRCRPQEPEQRSPQVAGGTAGAANPVLSEREREVVELVLLGLTYREIGARLYISAKTVEHHVARVRRRLGARSRAELLSMLRAMGHGSLLV